MKKFHFPLQKVLEYKEHVQDQEKNTLATMQLEHQKLCDRKRQMEAEYERCKREYLSLCDAGTHAVDVRVRGIYLAELSKQIEQMIIAIEHSQRRLEAQREVLLAVTKEKTSLEKLRGKYLQEYEAQQRKEDERFIGEFVANTSAT